MYEIKALFPIKKVRGKKMSKFPFNLIRNIYKPIIPIIDISDHLVLTLFRTKFKYFLCLIILKLSEF